MRRPDTRDAARLLGRALAAPAGRRLLPHRVRNGAFAVLANRLARSPEAERRAVAAALAAAMDAGDDAAALALASTAGRRPDLRAEKIVSRKYRYLWICNPKAASRSIVATLRAADPGAQLIRNRTLEAVLAAHPEARDYFRFAFLRDPVERALSFWADKHTLARTDRDNRRWFIDPWYGLSTGMGFEAFCRWLETPFGSDAFADRHWLSPAPPAARRRRAPAGVPRTLRASRRRLARALRPARPAVPRPAPAEPAPGGLRGGARRCRHGGPPAAALRGGFPDRRL